MGSLDSADGPGPRRQADADLSAVCLGLYLRCVRSQRGFSGRMSTFYTRSLSRSVPPDPMVSEEEQPNGEGETFSVAK